MDKVEFIRSSKLFFENWLNNVRNNIDVMKGRVSYPLTLSVYEYGSWFIAELQGEQNPDNKRILLESNEAETIDSITAFLNGGFEEQGNETPRGAITLNEQNSFLDLCLTTHKDIAIVEKFLDVGLNQSQLHFQVGDIPVEIRENSNMILMTRIDIISAIKLMVFYRYISTLVIIKKNLSRESYLSWLDSEVRKFAKQNVVIGIDYQSCMESVVFKRQLQSLAYQDVPEKKIDKFIKKHREQFIKALGYKRALNQVELI